MWQRILIPSCILLLCGGCYPNKAMIDPWGYAPLSPSNPWIPAPSIHPIALSDEPPDLPGQTDPYSLAEMIDIALRNNQQTKITWAQARSAAASYGQSQSSFFPSIKGNLSYERARQPITIITGVAPIATRRSVMNDVYYSLSIPQVTLSYLIYDFGTLRATSEASRQALYTADWVHNNAIASLLQLVMNDFYNYLYQKQLLMADVANIETAQITLDAADMGFNSGVRDISDVLQAKTQLLQNQTTWAGQQQNVDNAYCAMLGDMGLPATMELNTQEMPLAAPPGDVLPPVETLISLALQNRPDLMAYEANLRSKEHSLLAAKRQFLPQFNYDFDIGKNYYNKGLHDKYNFTSVFSVSMPLFQGFFYRNAIKIAEANKKAAEEQVRQSELNVIEQVTAYHYNVHVAFETLAFANGFLSAAKEQYTVAIAQYKQGTNTILNVVSAQSSLADARAQVASAAEQWYTSLANLAYSTGLLSPTHLDPLEPLPETIEPVAHEPLEEGRYDE